MRHTYGRSIQLLHALVVIALAVAVTPTSSGPEGLNDLTSWPGETRTLLSDGRWLVVGGLGPSGPRETVSLWDAVHQQRRPVADILSEPRAWHSATMLPDGTVLIAGGVGSAGIVTGLERFDPITQTLMPLSARWPAARAQHSATVLTDGTVLVAGGVDDAGRVLPTAEVWNLETGEPPATLVPPTPRKGHSATLLADGRVLLWGGTDAAGAARGDGDLLDPPSQRFVPVTAPPAVAAGPAMLAGSLPRDGAGDVPVDRVIALRFSAPLDVASTAAAVSLNGPTGSPAVTLVPAESGRLLFVRPQQELLPGARYTVSVTGLTDAEGASVAPATFAFTTIGPVTRRPASPTEPRELASNSDTSRTARPDDEAWLPDAANGWRTGRPESRWRSLASLQAPPGATALAGQVLRLNGEPLAEVSLRVGGAVTRTDDTGRFLLTGAAPGVAVLVIDGRTANRPGRTYGRFDVNVELKAGETVVLPYTIWMPALDTSHAVAVPRYTLEEVVATTPRIPGLEFRLPAQASIRDEDGHPVTEITITPIPLDRPPFPLPAGVEVPLYFTIQPGGAYVYARSGEGAALVYPNRIAAPASTKFQFWNYEAERKGWYVYGLGTVTPDGRQVTPDPGVRIYELTAAMVQGSASAPPEGTAPGSNSQAGDPVDLTTGLFVLTHTDLALPDVLPIALTRTYRPRDTISRAFGIGTSHSYDMFLVGNVMPYTWQELILPDGGRVHFDRISSGGGFADAVYEHTATPTRFYKARLAWNGNGWTITLKDGSVLVFPDSYNTTRPQAAALTELRDRFGNRLLLTRDSNANLTRIVAPSGRALTFSYDASGRVTQATDAIGRTVTYAYDGSGRLATVTDPAGGVTGYTYDAAHRMLTLTDARGITFLTNEYDTAGRVTRQTQADGTTYQFGYTLDQGTGKIAQTDVTDPRGMIRRVTFNSAGYSLTDTRAFGSALAQAVTSARAAGSNAVSSVTDALGRTTAYAYDTFGNLTSVTQLAGTGNAVATTFGYEPTFNQLASVTDGLGHTTSFSYTAQGALTVVTDPLGHATTWTRNAAGQVLTMTTPGGTTTLGYALTDVTSVTDPLGNVSQQFVDGAGRVASRTNPLGQQTRYGFDALNRVTTLTDAIGGVTALAYDPNGNLLSLTDARGNATVYNYNAMDRVATRTDPLLHAESYEYDGNGNVVTFTDRKGQVTTRTYDALDRLTQAGYADGSTTTYTWDAGNRLTQLADSIGGTISRTYDGLDRLTNETTPQGSVSYTYDAAGRRTSMTVAGQPTVTYAYDAADRLTSITQGSSVVQFASDAANRRTSLTLPNGVRTQYSYDAASQLTALTYTLGATTLGDLQYTYDAAGNRIQVGGTWARTGLPPAVASAIYNANNQQLTFGGQMLTYDLNGNLTGDGTNTYSWDARNRLAVIAGPVPAGFVYDGWGRRSERTVNGVTTDFLYDGHNPVQERLGQSATNLLTGLGIDEYLSRTNALETAFFLVDALGSAVALTDNTGAVSTQYTYEPFGVASVVGISTSNAYDFTGRETDATGLKYYRARYYNPRAIRFISEDPLGLLGGDVNLYVYVRNSPLQFKDPEGLFLPGAAVGFAIGFGAGAIGAWAGGGSPSEILVSAGLGGVTGALTGGVPGLSGPLASFLLGGASNLAGQLLAGRSCDSSRLNYGSLVGSAIGGALGARLGIPAASFAAEAGFGSLAQTATAAYAGAVASIPQGLIGTALGR